MIYIIEILFVILTVGLVLMQNPEPHLIILLAIFISSILVDIDKIKSYIDLKTKTLGVWIEKVFGHRNIIRSLLGVIFFSIILFIILII